MKRRFLILLLAAALLFAPEPARANIIDSLPIKSGDYGSAVVQVQQRLFDLGFLNFRATGRYGSMTKESVKSFQKRNSLSATGIVDEATYTALFSKNARRTALSKSVLRIVGPRTVSVPSEYGKLTDWKEIQEMFAVGDTATVKDLYTNKTYQVIRTGGVNHADVQTVGNSSQYTFLKTLGGSYTWEKRPVLVEIQGVKYAASIFGTPNANDAYPSSEMTGSVCLYFYNSASDIGGIPDQEHIKNVYIASTAVGVAK